MQNTAVFAKLPLSASFFSHWMKLTVRAINNNSATCARRIWQHVLCKRAVSLTKLNTLDGINRHWLISAVVKMCSEVTVSGDRGDHVRALSVNVDHSNTDAVVVASLRVHCDKPIHNLSSSVVRACTSRARADYVGLMSSDTVPWSHTRLYRIHFAVSNNNNSN